MYQSNKINWKTVVMIIAASMAALYSANAQENELNTWTELSISKKLYDNLKLSISPELRFDNELKIDKFLVETSLGYSFLKYFEIGAKYRFSSNPRDTKDTEYFHRFAFDGKATYGIERLNLQLRTRYTNYSEYDSENTFNNPYLRYRLKAGYNIKNCKITPAASIEFFHQLNDQEVNKVRYCAGIEYKINKKNYISFDYMYQDYLKKETAKNIIAIQYKFKF